MRQWLIGFGLFLVLGAGRNSSISELVQQLQVQHSFNYVLLLENCASAEDTLQEAHLGELSVPIIRLNYESNINYNLHKYHSKHLLSIAFVETPADSLLDFLSLNLRLGNTEPLLLILKQNDSLLAILQCCWQQNHLLNVLAIFENFQDTGLLYTYSPFPKFQIEERRISEKTNPIIIPRLRNLHGYNIPVAIGGSPPRLILYRRPNGSLVYSGYVGHLRHCFELKYNCRLIELLPLNETTSVAPQQLIEGVRNGSVQFALAPTYPGLPLQGYTYPLEQLKWCIMMPVPARVPPSELYARVMNLSTFMVLVGALVVISGLLSIALRLHGYRTHPHEFLIHNNCLRGVLGQSFNEVFRAPALVRGIYLEICILGFLVTAWYNSYFSAYITSILYEKPITSYESLLSSNIKVIVWTPEYHKLIGYSKEMEKYKGIFKFVEDYQQYLLLRESFNTRYGYMMPLDKWNIIQEQQKSLSAPLFTLRDDFCFYHGIPIVFPIAEISVFREPLERLVGEVTATGLMAHWRVSAFSEMITAGKLKLVDIGSPSEFRPMQLADLNYVLMLGGLMMSLAFMVFVLEHVWFHRMYLYNLI